MTYRYIRLESDLPISVADLGEGDGGDRPSLQEKFLIFPSKSERK